jgi:hypothetical protein
MVAKSTRDSWVSRATFPETETVLPIRAMPLSERELPIFK